MQIQFGGVRTGLPSALEHPSLASPFSFHPLGETKIILHAWGKAYCQGKQRMWQAQRILGGC